MKTIAATIEMAKDGGFSIYCQNEMFSGMGDTIENAKKDMETQIAFYVEHCQAEKASYPQWLDEPYEIDYQTDVQSLLEYYSGVITPAALHRLTGINQKQIWSYAHGKSKPRKPQIEKIQNGLRQFAKELSSITLL